MRGVERMSRRQMVQPKKAVTLSSHQLPPEAPEERESLEQRLHREAVSERHLLTHLPKNPFCKACAEGKAFQKPARRRRPVIDEEPKLRGHTLLGDHCSPG